jgi:excisionase family DNA binding protein
VTGRQSSPSDGCEMIAVPAALRTVSRMTSHRNDALYLYKPAEAAALLQVGEATVRRAARNGSAAHVRLSGRNEIRFTAEQLPPLRDLLCRTPASPPIDEPPSSADPMAAALKLLEGVQSLRR